MVTNLPTEAALEGNLEAIELMFESGLDLTWEDYLQSLVRIGVKSCNFQKKFVFLPINSPEGFRFSERFLNLFLPFFHCFFPNLFEMKSKTCGSYQEMIGFASRGFKMHD
jgi:hypothetical protein